jgi:SAM-dependent methyltransferase
MMLQNPDMDFAALLDQLRAGPPEPFTRGEPKFWDDPHIAKSMLAVHLDPNTEAASRPPARIERTVEWIVAQVGLKPGQAVLDLGCGPGLYGARFSAKGLRVTGVDLSEYSIAYAKEHDPKSDYRVLDYTEPFDLGRFDAVLLIYGDYCVLPPDKRKSLLANVTAALNPDGRLVFDVSTRAHRRRAGATKTWSAEDGGFWRPGPHLVLQQGFDYPELDVWLDQYVVVDEERVAVYRNWFQDYTPDSIRTELESNGFAVESLWSDLAGTPLKPTSEWIGVVCAAP